MRRFRLFVLALSFWPHIAFPKSSFNSKPKLIVMIVIDQFRADYLTRFENRFLPAKNKKGELGGFRFLMENSAYFPFGQYDLAQSITSVGHSTVLTGAYPYQSGISSNKWFNRDLARVESSVEDPKFPLLGEKPAGSPASPRSLIASTVGDELKNAGYSSKVISVALKDRAAIFMAGKRADLALWYDHPTHQWVSSRYYASSLPTWVEKYNQEISIHFQKPVTWKITKEGSGLTLNETLIPERESKFIEKSFPHSATVGQYGSMMLPQAVEMTRVVAEKALKEFDLGKHSHPDLLAVSFSSHDMLGHAFGPNSREMEELTLIEDREISHFLNTLNRSLSLQDCVIAFTGDHGSGYLPEWLKENKVPAERVIERELAQKITAHLNHLYKTSFEKDEWVHTCLGFHVYLNYKTLATRDLSLEVVEAQVKDFLSNDKRFAFIATSSEMRKGIYPPGIHTRQVMHSFYRGRSGDLLILPKPYISNDSDPVNHISGYSYDRTVPILIHGSHIKPKRYAERAEVVDIAPTLSYLLGLIPPSLSEGRVLSEILKN